MCSVSVCFNHYCLFYWDTHFSLSQKAYWKRVWQIIACRILIWHFVFDYAFVFAHLIVFVSAESQSVPLLAGGESRWSESARDRLSCWVARAEQPAPLLVYLPLRNFDFSPQIFCPLFCGFAEDTHPSKCIMQKLREQKIPIWVRVFVSAFSILKYQNFKWTWTLHKYDLTYIVKNILGNRFS